MKNYDKLDAAGLKEERDEIHAIVKYIHWQKDQVMDGHILDETGGILEFLLIQEEKSEGWLKNIDLYIKDRG